ncbi:Nif3-like dinuclear metal center hexameric protein [Zobellella maritima]|uniref:Nif3-like dinuclear metal center hexameric protein n=1 Tax=Zobellella maritima TaxID=2059725 RepID=UPI000E305437|nr:Nif3-like dinuclear metal center hexameric protein [Zobellella maritima]
MNNIQLEQTLGHLLNVSAIKDYSPNGLQVEGKREVRRVVTGVTASQALIDQAIKRGADALLVHHGYFWKGEKEVLTGMKRQRLKALLSHDINLYAYHLPLDIHPQLGNNAQLARVLDIRMTGPLEPGNALSVAVQGELDQPLTGAELSARITERLGRAPLHVGEAGPALIGKVAWCTGGGQGYIELAAEQGVDAFITGEVSEQTVHIARELGVHFYAAGHHATERYGIQALGQWLAKEQGLSVAFVDIDNPA